MRDTCTKVLSNYEIYEASLREIDGLPPKESIVEEAKSDPPQEVSLVEP